MGDHGGRSAGSRGKDSGEGPDGDIEAADVGIGGLAPDVLVRAGVGLTGSNEARPRSVLRWDRS